MRISLENSSLSVKRFSDKKCSENKKIEQFVERSETKIILAIPSKGRLREQSLAWLAAVGLPVDLPTDGRSYRAGVKNRDDIDILFLSASEIARELGSGVLDLGVTGEDLVRESVPDVDERVKIELPLGFGQADVVVAVPQVWHDVTSMRDLGDVAADFRLRHGRRLRIATKYWRLTRAFFSQRHGIELYRIVNSLGATEAAPAAGSADIIVDITSTGSTLAANGLKLLGDGLILRSQACLISSRCGQDKPDLVHLLENLKAARL